MKFLAGAKKSWGSSGWGYKSNKDPGDIFEGFLEKQLQSTLMRIRGLLDFEKSHIIGKGVSMKTANQSLFSLFFSYFFLSLSRLFFLSHF